MPYWGANVRNHDYVVQAKIHSEKVDDQSSEELVEFIKNITNFKSLAKQSLAQFFAEKIAAAYQGHPDALWVTVDILTTEGRTFGETRMIKEQD